MTARTAILVAFPPEWAALAHRVVDPVEHRIAGRLVLAGTLADRPVLLAETGISMVNAAMTTQAVIDRFAASRIIVSGIAGGIDPGFAIGDVLVPARWGQFLEVAMGRAQPGGFGNPALPGATDLPGFGMMHPRDVILGSATEGAQAHRWFPADPDLLAIAATLADGPPLACRTADGQGLGHQPRVVTGGTGVSGPGFVDNADYRRYLATVHDARLVDMESAAAAQVAFANGVPFIAFRSLSDLAGGDEGANRMTAFMALAAASSATIVERFVAAMPD